jgi:hypothetical protein
LATRQLNAQNSIASGTSVNNGSTGGPVVGGDDVVQPGTGGSDPV